MDNHPICEMRKWILPLFLSLALVLTGCVSWSLPFWKSKDKDATAQVAPQPSGGLAKAEANWDKVNDQIVSKTAAAVGQASILAEKNPPSLNNDAIRGELSVAKALIGEPSPADAEAARKRAEAVLAGVALVDAYKKAVEEAQLLRIKMAEADKNYETEKATQKAKYEAQISVLQTQAAEARKDKFFYLGGFICLVGVGAIFFWPNKVTAAEVILVGVAICGTPFVMDTPNFKWFLTAVGVIVVAKVGWFFFLRKKPSAQCADSPTVS